MNKLVKSFAVFHHIPSDKAQVCKIIGTHDGTFHCDEALACALLTMTKQFGTVPLSSDASTPTQSIVVRTRDESVLANCDLICDVGAKYDPSTFRFDHHQSSFTDTLNSVYKTRLSTSGLIYKHFGREILSNIFSYCNINDEMTNKYLEKVYDRIYKNFMEHIDAIDNGINVADGPLRYQISSTLSNRVSRFNPSWTLPSQEARQMENSQFQKAVELTGNEFVEVVVGLIQEWLPARSIVEAAVDKRMQLDSSGQIICLEKFCPWKEHLYDIENEKQIEGQIKYALFQDVKGTWRIQCVSETSSSFKNRLSLPKEWLGLRDEELSQKSGIPGGIFVHASGFIGGNQTFEGVLQMAKVALQQSQ